MPDPRNMVLTPALWDPLVESERFRRLHSKMFGRPVEIPKVGRYELGPRLGAGAAGCVHEGRDPVLRRRVAIKLVPVPAGLADAERESLLAEAQALASLDHPSLVKVHDAGISSLGQLAGPMELPRVVSEQSTLYMVMELVGGPSLCEWSATGPGTAQILRVYRELGEALAAAHAAGIAHRDFKPDNVAFDSNGRPKLLDFGLAGAASSEAQGSEDRPGLGTPVYMAPEQHAAEFAGPEADQFAFCVSLWEALAGLRPFSGADVEELQRQKRACRPEGGRGIRRGIRSVLLRGLSPQPSMRWSTMLELLAALRAAQRRPLLVGATVVAVAGALSVYGLIRSQQVGDVCGDVDAPIWNRFEELRVSDSFRRTMPLGSAETTELVSRRFSSFSESWSETLLDVCESAGPQQAASLSCLDEARATGQGVLAAMVRHGGGGATKLLDLLPFPEDCRTLDAAIGSGATPYRAALVEFRARFLLGEFDAVLSRASSMLEVAAVPDEVRAEWSLLAALAHSALGHPELAKDGLRATWELGERAGNRRAAVAAMTALASAMMLEDPKQALGLLELAELRRDSVDSRRRIAIDASWGQYHLLVTGDVDAAQRHWNAVLQTLPDQDINAPVVVALTSGIARVSLARGDFAAAEEGINRVLESPDVDLRNAFVGNLFYVRGTSRWLRGQLVSAAADWDPEGVAQTASTALERIRMRIRVLALLGDLGRAAGEVERFAATEPAGHAMSLVRPLLALRRGQFSSSPGPAPWDAAPIEWEARLLEAGRLLNDGRDQEALRMISRALESGEQIPDFARVLLVFDCASLLSFAGAFELAAEALKTLEGHASLFVRTRRELAVARAELGAGHTTSGLQAVEAAAVLLAEWPEPWRAGQLELGLLEAVVMAQRGALDQAATRAGNVMSSDDGLGNLALVESASLLADPSFGPQLRTLAFAWTRGFANVTGSDAPLAARLLSRYSEEAEPKPLDAKSKEF